MKWRSFAKEYSVCGRVPISTSKGNARLGTFQDELTKNIHVKPKLLLYIYVDQHYIVIYSDLNKPKNCLIRYFNMKHNRHIM